MAANRLISQTWLGEDLTMSRRLKKTLSAGIQAMDDKLFLPVFLTKEGAFVDTVILPKAEVEDQPEEAVLAAANEMLSRMDVAKTYLDPELLKELAKQQDLVEPISNAVSVMLAGRIAQIYSARTKGKGFEELSSDEPVESRKDAVTRLLKVRELLTPIGQWIKPHITKSLPADISEQVHGWIWQNQIAWAQKAMERDLGRDTVLGMSSDEFRKLLDEYMFVKQDFALGQQYLLVYFSQFMSEAILESWDIEHRPIADIHQLLSRGGEAEWPPIDPSKMPWKTGRKGGSPDAPRSVVLKVPDAFPDGTGRFPNNPLIFAGLSAIWKGGSKARRIVGGWQETEAGQVIYQHLPPRGGGRILVYPNLVKNASNRLPTTPDLWKFVESLNPFTSDVALAVFAQMLEPSAGDKPKYPLLEPVRITADAILKYKGIQRWGMENRLMKEKIQEEMERLTSLRFDIEEMRATHPDTGRYDKRSWEGDRLFDIVKVEQWQEGLFGGRERVEVSWSVRAGQWAYWWMNAQGRVWIARMSRVLLELDHRENRGAAVIAKLIGQRIALLAGLSHGDRPLELTVATLLEEIGELPTKEEQKRNYNWAGRTRERFDDALLKLKEAGVFANVEWLDGHGPGDADRSKGWLEKWLKAKIRFTLPEAPPELPKDKVAALAPSRSRGRPKARRNTPAQEQRIDGSAIRAARSDRGWSQDALAEHIGVSRPYLSLIEQGKRLPSKSVESKLRSWMSSRG